MPCGLCGRSQQLPSAIRVPSTEDSAISEIHMNVMLPRVLHALKDKKIMGVKFDSNKGLVLQLTGNTELTIPIVSDSVNAQVSYEGSPCFDFAMVDAGEEGKLSVRELRLLTRLTADRRA